MGHDFLLYSASPLLKMIDLDSVMLEGGLLGRSVEGLRSQPAPVPVGPVLPLGENPAATQQELGEPTSRSHRVLSHVLFSPDKFSDTLLFPGWNTDRSQLAETLSPCNFAMAVRP
jgi:hypothetical protein